VVVAALITLLGVVAFGDDGDAGGPADRPATSSTTTSSVPTTSTTPPTTVQRVEVPDLTGMELATAKGALAGRGLKATVRYRATDRSPAGTVISQSRTSGAGVPAGSRITLVVAKAPPPPPPTTAPATTAPPPPTTAPERDCDPSYPDDCLDSDAADYDGAGGSGNGPEYVDGPVRVRPPDPFDLDREGDGWGCESG
jgi:beta-lactam-binding protein with PASTA domain